jgi:chorismate dehydratase
MKIAVTDFINARPLIQGFAERGVQLMFDSPRGCAQALENGTVDFALLPSIEYARMDGISIIPGICVSSIGPVKSVLLFLKKELSQIRNIAVDQRSRTAAALLKILARELFKINPEYLEISPSTQSPSSDAALVIGDHALKEVSNFKGQVIDLGEVWGQWTQLPFTYAFWVGREASINPECLAKFYEVKENGMLLRFQIAQETLIDGLGSHEILDYLTKNICYDWSSFHEKGLKLFYEMAFRNHLINRIPDLRFFHVEEHHFTSARRKEN